MIDMQKLRREMDIWRHMQGEVPLPPDYIKLHENAARADVDRFCADRGMLPVKVEMVPDGWADGMQVLCVTAQNDVGQTATFRWSDSGGGSWFRHVGGWALVAKAPTAPGYI